MEIQYQDASTQLGSAVIRHHPHTSGVSSFLASFASLFSAIGFCSNDVFTEWSCKPHTQPSSFLISANEELSRILALVIFESIVVAKFQCSNSPDRLNRLKCEIPKSPFKAIFLSRRFCYLYGGFLAFFSSQLTQLKPPRNINLFDDSSPFIKMSLYISLGVLAGLLLFGTLWNILLRKKRKAKPTKVLGEHLTYIVVCSSNQGKMTSLLTRHSHTCG